MQKQKKAKIIPYQKVLYQQHILTMKIVEWITMMIFQNLQPSHRIIK